MSSALDDAGHLKLVIFDCDGVLVDSEGPSCRATAQFAQSLGLSITEHEAFERFAGKALPQIVKELEEDVGHELPQDTAARLRDNLIRLMEEQAEPVDGAAHMLAGVLAAGLPIRVGSNSSIKEMEAKFDRTDMTDAFPAERIHSANDMGHPKPSPEVYLHAARTEGVKAEECVVIEDSDTGAEAALKAGMACVLLRDADAPLPTFWPAPGFVRISHLSELVPMLRNALKAQKQS